MIVTIIIVYSILLGMIIYYAVDNNNRKNKLEKKVETLETNLKLYYENVYDGNELGKLFIFPRETNIEFDDDGIMSGEAFIYKDGVIEIALYDGKYCAYKKNTLEIIKANIKECVVNRQKN